MEWLRTKEPSASKAVELYGYYDDYLEEIGYISFETYKRYCREAVKKNR